MKFIILFNFIIFILFCLLFQKIKIYDLLVIIIMFSYFKGNLFNILIFLFCFNLLLKFAFYVKNELFKRNKGKIKINELKPGDVIIWRKKYNKLAFPMFDILQSSTLFFPYSHIMIVDNNNYILHSVHPNSRSNLKKSSKFNNHNYEKIKITDWVKDYTNDYDIEVIPIKKNIKLKKINYLNLYTNKLKILHIINFYIDNFNFKKQYEKENTYGCIGYVNKIKELNNLSDYDYSNKTFIL